MQFGRLQRARSNSNGLRRNFELPGFQWQDGVIVSHAAGDIEIVHLELTRRAGLMNLKAVDRNRFRNIRAICAVHFNFQLHHLPDGRLRIAQHRRDAWRRSKTRLRRCDRDQGQNQSGEGHHAEGGERKRQWTRLIFLHGKVNHGQVNLFGRDRTGGNLRGG